MSCDGWKEVKLGEIIHFNPKLVLKKGTFTKKVTMQGLTPFERKISEWSVEKFNSGTKFENGDTLLARITPCLENGKTAYVNILEQGEVAFGSTEFIVMRPIEGITDGKFIYYLTISPKFRGIAIQSMTGSSGRQRVQLDTLKNTTFSVPSLKEQEKIARILSSIDDKIELNHKINQDLEEMAQAIFKSWFVDFEPFRDGEFVDSELGPIPKGWRVGGLGELIEITSGKRPKRKNNQKNDKFCIPLIGASKVMGYVEDFLFDTPIITIGRVGTLGVVQRINTKCWPSDNTLIINSDYQSYVYQVLGNIDYSLLNRGSTQPLITQTDIKNINIIIPDNENLLGYEKIVKQFFLMIDENTEQNQILSNLRDTLLPKLMSGEIRV